MMHEKIRPHHLECKAILYVRQSSAHQVLHNRESSALQYAMRDRLTSLGWSRVEIIDDDLGRSAAGTVTRPASNGWLPRFALARSALWPRGRCLDLRATAGTGSSSSRCAASSIPF